MKKKLPGTEMGNSDVERRTVTKISKVNSGDVRHHETRLSHTPVPLNVEDAHPLLKDTFRDALLIRDPIITRSIYPIIKRLNEILNQARQWIRVISGQNIHLRYELENNLRLLNTRIDRYAVRSDQNAIYLTPIKEELNRVISQYLSGLDEEQGRLKAQQEHVGNLIESARAKIQAAAVDRPVSVGQYKMPRGKREVSGRDPNKK